MSDPGEKTYDIERHLREIERVTTMLSGYPYEYLPPKGSKLPDVDWYVLAAIRKTASLSHAFCTLVRSKNTLSAAALVRLQLDTALRIFGLGLVEDIDDAGERLMNDESFRKLRSRSGEPLTDAFLHRQLDQKYPGLTKAYEDASSYVHLSSLHIKTGLSSQAGTATLYFHLNATDEGRPDEWFADIVDAFDQATRLTSDLITLLMTARRETVMRIAAEERRRSSE